MRHSDVLSSALPIAVSFQAPAWDIQPPDQTILI